MKKRALALFLALIMTLSVFAGLTLTANAANYNHNSSPRGVVCTALSSAALSYWTGNYSFATLNAQSGDTLRSTLRAKITSNRNTVGYDGLKTYFPYTDCYLGDTSKVTLFYANRATSSEWNANSYWNREHMWPDSLGGNAMEGDLHAMRPTDAKANSTRGNLKYGNVRELYPTTYKEATTNASNGSVLAGYYVGNTLFEPLDVSKGDAARVLLYDYVVATSMNSPTVAIKDIQTLLEWHALDPVDAYEMERNDIAQSIQGCRNPFVDYPELAWRLFTDYTMPSNLATPSNGGNTGSYTVTATSNNTAWGTVSVSGTTITASPNTGYYAAGYTVTAGTATVTQNGNIFQVSPSTDCTVRINFAAKTTVTLTYMANGSQYSTVSSYAGDAVALPSDATAVTGWTFDGWSDATISATTTKPSYYAPGATVTPTANTTYYAVYKQTEGGSGEADSFTLLTSSPDDWEGEYVLTSGSAAKVLRCDGTSPGSTNAAVDFANTGMTKSGDTLTNVDDTYVLVIENVSGSDYSLKLKGSSTAQYLSSANSNSLNTAAANTSNDAKWTLSVNSGGATITNVAYSSRTIRYNSSSSLFRTYTSGQSAVYLYRGESGGTVTYTTSPTNAQHTHTLTHTAAHAADCTAAGNVEYWHCTGCGKYFSDAAAQTEITQAQTVSNALGHNYGSFTSNNNGTHSKTCSRCGDVVTEDCAYTTSTSGATTTYTCSVCNYSYQTTAPTYTVTYNDRGTTASVSCVQGESVTLPATASTVTGYTFAGWVTAAIATETATAPTVLTGTYQPSGNITLYAVYTRIEQGQGGASEVVYTLDGTSTGGTSGYGEASSITQDDITWSVMGNTQMSPWRIGGKGDQVREAFSTTAMGSAIAKVDLTVGSITCTVNSVKLIVASDADFTNQLAEITKTSVTANSTLTFVPTSGASWATGAYYKFVFDVSCASGSNQFVQLSKAEFYSVGASDVTYYTTAPAASTPCDHNGTLEHQTAAAATCTGTGNIEYWHCTGCGKYFSDAAAQTEITQAQTVISALGHNYTWTVTQAASCTAAGTRTGTCTRCGATATETIAAAGHTDANGDGVCDVCGVTMAKVYTLNTTLNNGDEVVIFYPAGNLALSTTASGSKLTGVSETPANGQLTVSNSTTAVFTVDYADATNFRLKTADNKYLTTVAAGNALSLADTADDYSLWYLEVRDAAAQTVYIRSTNAAYNGNKNQALEYYSNGFTVYGIKETDIYTFALYTYSTDPGTDYTVSFSVPDGVAAIADMTSNTNTGITLPTAGAPEGYTFLGWVDDDYNNVTFRPAIIWTGTYFAAEDITLKALYTRHVNNGGGTVYELVTATPDDWEGEYVISYRSGSNMAVLTSRADEGSLESSDYASFLDAAGITLADDALSNVPDAYAFRVEAVGTGVYSLKNKDAAINTYLACVNNYLTACPTYSTPACDWTITLLGSGYVQISSETGSSYPYLSFYSSKFWQDTSVNQICLWRGKQAGTDYFTTVPAAVCTHANAALTGAVAATCTTAGNSAYWTCPDCGKYFSDAACETEIEEDSWNIPALGHDYQAVVTEPTCTAGGYTTHTCSRCHDTYVDSETEALGHHYENGVCTVCGERIAQLIEYSISLKDDVNMNFYLNLSEGFNVANAAVTFAWGEGAAAQTVTGTLTAVQNAHGANYVVSCGVPAKHMTDLVTMTLLYDGDEILSQSYSVAGYAASLAASLTDNAENSETNAKLRTLLCNMLDYGAAAQIFFGYRTDALANAGVNAIIDGWQSPAAPARLANPTSLPSSAALADLGLKFEYTTLMATANTAIRLYFSVLDGADLTAVNAACGETPLVFRTKGSLVYLEIGGIAAKNIFDAYTVTLTSGGNAVNITYSAADYYNRVMAADDASLKAVMGAMYNYSLSAAAYLNN